MFKEWKYSIWKTVCVRIKKSIAGWQLVIADDWKKRIRTFCSVLAWDSWDLSPSHPGKRISDLGYKNWLDTKLAWFESPSLGPSSKYLWIPETIRADRRYDTILERPFLVADFFDISFEVWSKQCVWSHAACIATKAISAAATISNWAQAT